MTGISLFCFADARLQVDGVAVGFMSLCKDINIDILNNCFELAPFHGLRKPHPDDVVKRSFPDSASPLPVMPGKLTLTSFELMKSYFNVESCK